MKILRMKIGNFIRKFGRAVTPHYWRCFNCGNVEWQEREVLCWKCGIGEMLYKG